MRAISVLTYIKLILTMVFWGGTFIAGRIVMRNEHIDPYSIAFMRFALASAVLIVMLLKAERKLPSIKMSHILPIIVLGASGIFAYNILFLKGLKIIEASRASLIIATCPVFLALGSACFFKEKLGLIKIIGILLSITGAAIVITKGRLVDITSQSIGLAELYIAGCVLCWTIYSLIGKCLMSELSPLTVVAYSCVVGSALLLIPALKMGLLKTLGHYSYTDFACIAYLGLLGTVVGFVWYYEGISDIGAVRAGLFINLVPVSAVLLGFLILSEPVTYSLLFGGLLVIAGVYLTNRVRS